MNIAVLGLGHVGLPNALGFAELGWTVFGTDCDERRVKTIGDGTTPFFEPGMNVLLEKHLNSKRFRVTTSLDEAVGDSGMMFVCVGTPQQDDGSADLSQIETVIRNVSRHVSGYKLIIEKSTTPVRTAEQIKRAVARYTRGNAEVDVAVNPEFLQEGSAMHDVMHPDKIVVGVESDRARSLLQRVYEPLLVRMARENPCGQCERAGRDSDYDKRLLLTDLNTAEIIKHAANAFLATKISFINMVADLCEATGADVADVAAGIGIDPRIGPGFLKAGIGFGGYCLPKDLRAFSHIAESHGVDFSLLRSVENVNDRRIDQFLEKIRKTLWTVRGKAVAVLGVAFKPGTDDVRESPSLKLISRLLDEEVSVRIYDPRAMSEAMKVLPARESNLVYCESAYDAAEDAHALLVLTEWDEFKRLDFQRIQDAMEVPVMLDGRNIYSPAEIRRLGFEYASVGRP